MQSPGNKKRKYPDLNNLWIGLFVDIMGFYIIIPYLPELIDIFNTTPFVISALLATNAVFSLFSAPMWGRLSDRYGRKPMLLIAESGTCTAFLILAFSNSLPMLFIARIVDGIFGGNFPITKAIISDKVPPRDRGIQMTNFGVVFTLAGLVAPALGGFLSIYKIFGPAYPLALSGIIAASFSFLTILITFFFIKESWPKTVREKAQKEFKVTIKIWKNKDAVFLLTQYALHSLSFIMYVTTLTFFIRLILGLNTVGISILLTISGISRAIVRFSLFKPTLKRLGEKKMTILGLCILVIAFFLTGVFGLVYPETWVFIVLIVFVSYGVSCSRGLLISKVTQSVTPKEMGKINGYTTTFDSLAQAIGPLLGVLLLGINPVLYGIATGTLAFGAFIMIFKKITPLMRKDQFKLIEPLE
ncbi:MAG: MFS transporter [Promethearchaeota archaeon]|jgi:MFS family permease